MLPKVVDLALSPCHAAERLNKACHWHAEDTAFSGDKDTLCELPSPGCVPIANKSLSPCRSAGTPKATKDRCKRQTARIQKNDCTFSDPAMSKRPSGRPCAYRNEEQMEAHPKFASVAQSYRISALHPDVFLRNFRGAPRSPPFLRRFTARCRTRGGRVNVRFRSLRFFTSQRGGRLIIFRGNRLRLH